MKGRVIPTVSLMILTAAVSAGVASYRSGSNSGDGQTEQSDWPTPPSPGAQEKSSRSVPTRADDLSNAPTSVRGPNRSLEDEIGELQDAVTALSRAVAALERDRMDHVGENRDAVDATFDAAPGSSLEQPTDFLTQRYEIESRDARWAARAEPVISNAFRAGDLASSQLIYNSCRATVCRIEVSHDDAAAAESFLFQLLPQVSDEFPAVETRLIDDAYGLRSVVLLGNAD